MTAVYTGLQGGFLLACLKATVEAEVVSSVLCARDVQKHAVLYTAEY